MKSIIGFSDYGHLGTHSAEAARIKGFTVSERLEECDIVYVSPDRPGEVSPPQAVAKVLQRLRENAVLVVLCQTMPGFMQTVRWPEERLYYQVETLRMSDAKERAVNPERIILGHCGKGFLDRRLQQFLTSFDCPLILMSYESAELTKIAINLYLAAQVSTTNTLVEIADKIGADWNDIIPALQTDRRISKDAYLQPGFGLSSHLERDLKTIIGMDGNTEVMKAFLAHSEYRRKKSA